MFAQVAETRHDVREWADLLAAEGVLVTIVGGRIRMLTHLDIGASDIEAALGAWRRAVKAAR